MALSLLLILMLLILLILNFFWINKNKWRNVFYLFFCLLLLIPADAQGIFSGAHYNTAGILNLSLAGYDILIVVICALFTRKKLKNITKHKIISILLCIAVIIGIRFIIDGFSAPSNKMFDNYCLPIVTAILMAGYLDKNDLKKILNFLYKLILFNAIIACIEYFIGESLFFHEYYIKNVAWYNNIYNSTNYGIAFRSTALLGHPLTNGVYYLIGLAYIYNKRKMRFNISSLIQTLILVFAVFTTNSRIDIVLLFLLTLIMLLKEKRIIEILLLILIGIFALLKIDFVSIYYSLFSRDTTGSSLMVRINALDNFLKIPFNTLLFGTGYNNTKELLVSIGLNSNLEISFLIILLENGLIAFVAWLITLFSFFTTKMTKNYEKIPFKSIIISMFFCFIIATATSNSIGDPGTLNYMLLAIMGFSYIASSSDELSEKEVKSWKK